MKLYGWVGHASRTNQLDFGGDLGQCPDRGFQRFLVDSLLKFLEGWGVAQRTIICILVVIRMTVLPSLWVLT